MRVFSDLSITIIYCVLMIMSGFVVYYSIKYEKEKKKIKACEEPS